MLRVLPFRGEKRHRFGVLLAAAMLAGAGSGCASQDPANAIGNAGGDGGQEEATGLAQISLPSLPPLTGRAVVGTPTEVYTRVAQGALTCWFGAEGPLKGAYVYHAEALPPSKGGQARIVIHARDDSRTDRRGKRAYLVDILPDGQGAKLSVHNATMTQDLALRMQSDVDRWAADETGCLGAATAEDWNPSNVNSGAEASKSETKKAGAP